MSINSRIIRDSLGLNPINTGLSASIGLFYMLDRTLHHVKDGDVIIICPEYSQFYDGLSSGTEELVQVVFDTAPAEVFKLRRKQLLNSLRHVPKYSLAKFKIWRYWPYASDTAEVYVRTSFNEFGDLTKHWNLPLKPFAPLALLKRTDYDPEVVESLKNFQEAARAKGAIVFITFPALHEQSYDNDKHEFNFIDAELRKHNFDILGNPSRYCVTTELMFDSPYHLTQTGVTTRTEMLVNDLREAAKGTELEFFP